MDEDFLIRLLDVRLSLPGPAGSVEILKGVNVDIAAGSKVSLVGPSGSGKTSLMMVLAGLERTSGGRILIGGQELGGLDEDALARFRRDWIGIVFQNFHLLPTMTAMENVALPLELAGALDAQDRAEASLVGVGLKHRLKHFPGQLSGGEQQRVALARAFVTRPKILLADEPTGNLDQQTGKEVMALMFDLHHRYKTTLILITHDAGLAASCERRLQMDNGVLSWQ